MHPILSSSFCFHEGLDHSWWPFVVSLWYIAGNWAAILEHMLPTSLEDPMSL